MTTAGSLLAPEPIDEPTRSRLGFPKEGSVRSLVVKVPSHTEKTILFHAEYPWSAHGSIPLVALPKKYLLRGMILVESPAGIRTRVETVGLRRLDPSIVNDLAVETDPKDDAGNRPDRSSASRPGRPCVCLHRGHQPARSLHRAADSLSVDRDRPGGHPHDVRRSQRIVPESPATARQFRGGAFARSGSVPKDDVDSCSPRRIRCRSDPVESRRYPSRSRG